MSKLSCGGRGPCCHVGYAHRHCEHCDTVIMLSVPQHTHSPGWYGVSGIYNGTLQSQLGGLNTFASQMQQALSPATEVHIDAGQ